MKKALIAIIGATLLAVGCSNNKSSAPRSKKFTFNDAISYYESFNITGVTLPEYEAKNSKARAETVEDYLEDEELLEVRITYSPREEMVAYVTSLKKGGWSLTKDDNGDYYGTYKRNELAQIYVQDWTLETYDGDDNIYDAIRIFFSHGAIPSPEWPEEGLQSIFEEYDETYFEAPEFEGENALFTSEVYLYYGVFPTGAMVVVSGATAEEINNYLEVTLPGAGWSVQGDSAYGTATKTFVDLGGVATIEFGTDGEDFLIILDFGLGQIPSETFPTEDIAAGFEALGLPAFPLIEPDGEGYTYNYQFDEYNLDYLDSPTLCYDYVYIHNVDPEEFAAYQTKLEINGWHTESEASPFDYYKHFEEQKITAHIRVKYIESETGADSDITITVYYIVEEDPLDAWPAEEIAALLGEGITDILPSAEYEDSKYRMTQNGLTIYVSEEYVDALISNYNSTLISVGFTFSEETGIYSSQNNQYNVKITANEDGTISIVLLVPGFISRNAQEFLESRGLDGDVAPDFSSLENYFDSDKSLDISYKVWLNGDHTEAIKTILGEDYAIPETPSETWGYECLNNAETIEIDFKYDSDLDQTIIWFYYYPDIA